MGGKKIDRMPVETEADKQCLADYLSQALEDRDIRNNGFAVSVLVPAIYPLLRDDWEKVADEMASTKAKRMKDKYF